MNGAVVSVSRPAGSGGWGSITVGAVQGSAAGPGDRPGPAPAIRPVSRVLSIPGEQDSDASLVAAATQGSRDALDVLLRRHHDRLFAVCRGVTGDQGDAADATQEALVSIVRGLSRFDGRASFSTWSHRVAVNAALDELRRRRRRPLVVPGIDAQPGTSTGSGAEVAHAYGEGDLGGDGDIGSVADRVDIDAALRRLPPEFRVAVVLRDLSGLSYAEIAQVVDVPIGTVRSRIARGRAALADMLAPVAGGDGGQR